MSILSNVAVQWLIRRIPDWGGWIGTVGGGLLLFYNSLTPQQQNMINGLLQGNWQDITLGSLVPFAILVYSQIISFRATTKPETVTQTPDGTTVAVPTHYNTESVEAGRTKPPKKTLFDILRGN